MSQKDKSSCGEKILFEARKFCLMKNFDRQFDQNFYGVDKLKFYMIFESINYEI